MNAHEKIGRHDWPEIPSAAYEWLFQCVFDPLLLTRPGRDILRANEAATRLLGMTEAEICARGPRDIAVNNAALRELITTRSQTGSARAELILRRGDGSEILAEVTTSLVPNSPEPLAYVKLRDITEREQVARALRETEQRYAAIHEKFRHVQKMEAIGRLAGGIAHDFNNLLTVILGHSTDALAGLFPGDPLQEAVQEIEKAGHRAAALTRQLLAFSRRQVLEPRVFNVNELILGAEKMLRRIVSEDIEVTVLLDARPQLCKLDKGQFEQVLLNLVVNARDAMSDGGRLTIETASVVLDESYVDEHPDATPGEHVRVTVSDTGVGMPKEVLPHIFEPFFTTKGLGRGTGLGLSTVYGIVRQSGGTIWVYSEPGKGTSFKIYLPRSAEGAVELPLAMPSVSTTRGKETILVVEDDEQVRTTISGMLRRAGYHVISTSNGGEALLICEQHGGTIHLLLTDVVMPKLNGPKLAERLRQVRPAMRVLFTSGYTENVVVHHGILDPNLDFLPKPLTSDALLTKAREVLDR